MRERPRRGRVNGLGGQGGNVSPSGSQGKDSPSGGQVRDNRPSGSQGGEDPSDSHGNDESLGSHSKGTGTDFGSGTEIETKTAEETVDWLAVELVETTGQVAGTEFEDPGEDCSTLE